MWYHACNFNGTNAAFNIKLADIETFVNGLGIFLKIQKLCLK